MGGEGEDEVLLLKWKITRSGRKRNGVCVCNHFLLMFSSPRVELPFGVQSMTAKIKLKTKVSFSLGELQPARDLSFHRQTSLYCTASSNPDRFAPASRTAT